MFLNFDLFKHSYPEVNPSLITVIDLSALCGTSSVNLKDFHLPEFAVLSFYKVFGYPTGIGALLIRKVKFLEDQLYPIGYAGGNVDKYNVKNGEFILKKGLEER